MDLKGLFGLEGKSVVVTGAGSGMGKAAARLLAELGANVHASVRRHPLDFEVAREIPSELGTKDGLDAFIAELPSEVDALFVCHGISNAVGMTNGLEVQLTNFLSFRYLTEALLPCMSEGASVTFISSNGGWEWCERAGACVPLDMGREMGNARGDGLPNGGAGKRALQLRERAGALHRLGLCRGVGAGDRLERVRGGEPSGTL